MFAPAIPPPQSGSPLRGVRTAFAGLQTRTRNAARRAERSERARGRAPWMARV